MGSVLIVGGGAAGLMAAYAAARRGADVTVAEKNSRPGRKLMITGKGRCNVTNHTDVKGLVEAVTGNGRFLYSAFSMFSARDTVDFFENSGVPLKTERGNRVFPRSDKAVDIVDALTRAALDAGAKIKNRQITGLQIRDGKVRGVFCGDRVIPADAVVVATGGLSYPLTGSTGDGYAFARLAGHTVVPPRPSLVPLETAEGWCSAAQGLSLRNIAFSVMEAGKPKPVFTDFGELMFTHYGISGPVVLSASAYLEMPENGRYQAVIDLKPALDMQTLDARIRRDFQKYSGKNFSNALGDLLPGKLIPVIVNLSKIDPKLRVGQISREQRLRLASLLKSLTLTVTGFRPIEEAVVTKGGVDLKEIEPKTMRSKIVPNLYFAGEVLDADAFTGGFNLQIAFSTGYAAGTAAGESVTKG